MAERLEFVPVKLRGPMTLFASITRRSHVMNRSSNWFWDLIERHGIKLISAGNLRARVGFRARSDVTFYPAHTRVSRHSVRYEFRLHCFVASLTAESDRFGMLISAITAKRAHDNENHGHTNESKEYTPTLRIIKINSGKLGDL